MGDVCNKSTVGGVLFFLLPDILLQPQVRRTQLGYDPFQRFRHRIDAVAEVGELIAAAAIVAVAEIQPGDTAGNACERTDRPGKGARHPEGQQPSQQKRYRAGNQEELVGDADTVLDRGDRSAHEDQVFIIQLTAQGDKMGIQTGVVGNLQLVFPGQ